MSTNQESEGQHGVSNIEPDPGNHNDDDSLIDLPNWRSRWPLDQWTHLVRRLLEMRPPSRRGRCGWRRKQNRLKQNEALETASDNVQMG